MCCGRRSGGWWCHLQPCLARRNRPTASVDCRWQHLRIVPLSRVIIIGRWFIWSIHARTSRYKESIQYIIGRIERVFFDVTAGRMIRSDRSRSGGRSCGGHPFSRESLPSGISGGGVVPDSDLIEGRWVGGSSRAFGRRRHSILALECKYLRSRRRPR